MKDQELALVYMVAGISSRYNKDGGNRIKAFAEVGPNHEALIEYSMKQALPAGFDKIIFTGPGKSEEELHKKTLEWSLFPSLQ